MRKFVLVAWGITLATASLAILRAQQQNPPVFRGGVDLVTVDVAVVDGRGQPVTGLAPRDFTIVADKRLRTVVSADYVSPPTRTRPEGIDASVPAPTVNTDVQGGRTFLFVVDVDQIAQGGGHTVLDAVGQYLDRLRPGDRVGVLSYPLYTPKVDLTTNRRIVADAFKRIIGFSTRNQDADMTVGEAAAIEMMDVGVVNEWLERNGQSPCDDSSAATARNDNTAAAPPAGREVVACSLRYQPIAVRIMNDERRRTRSLFDTLRALALAMGPLDGPKALILISQGLIADRQTMPELNEVAKIADRARVTLYALNLDAPLTDVTQRGNLMTAHTLDHQVLLDGMSNLAVASRGDVFMVSGLPTSALERIDAEMSGYYLLSFERDSQDRDGDRADIQVKVNWPGAIVRARTQFTAGRATPAARRAVPADLKAAIGELLLWPVPLTEIAVGVDAYQTPIVDSVDGTRTILAASAASEGRALVAAGYEVTDAAGRKVADDFGPAAGRSLATQTLSDGQQLYAAAVELPVGTYRVKLGVIDDTGRRGSVEHAFEVRAVRAGRMRMGDLFFGELSAAAGLIPRPIFESAARTLPVRIDICGDTATTLNGAVVTLELGRPGAAPFARTPLTLADAGDRRRRIASATLAIDSLPPGHYVVTADLLAADGAELKTSRMFTKR